MPWMTIRVGDVAAGSGEGTLTEYLCDVPGCANIAEHAVGAVLGLALTVAVCPDHATSASPPRHPGSNAGA